MVRYGHALWVFGLLAVTACASSETAVEEASTSNITSGKGPVSKDPAAVAVISANNAKFVCTGLVLAPRVILTAGHCIIGDGYDKKGWRFQVFAGADRAHASSKDKTIDVAETHVHPTWQKAQDALTAAPATDLPPGEGAGDPGDGTQPQAGADDAGAASPATGTPAPGGDLAILILATPLDVAPMVWNGSDLSMIPDVTVGTAVRFLGYGAAGPDTEGGARRSGLSTIASVTAEVAQISTGDKNPCHGDSGGPLLAKINGVEKVIGIASTVKDETCASGVSYVRTDVYREFIRQLIDQYADAP